MSNIDKAQKLELLKEILKKIKSGEDVERIKIGSDNLLREVSPLEIPLLEQQLVLEGFSVNDIIKLCDLHLNLFMDYLRGKELKDIPEGHPLDNLLKENNYILKQAELLGIYTGSLARATNNDVRRKILSELINILYDLKKIRVHYRKIQMLIFPYLERRGLEAIPRVLWSKEDGVIKKIREMIEYVEKLLEKETISEANVKKIVDDTTWLSKEIADIVFRENKILFPTIWELFSEGEWTVIHEIGEEIGYIVETNKNWKPSAKPIYPFEIDGTIPPEKYDKIPIHVRKMIGQFKPDKYQIRKENDIELDTGFLNREEIEGLFRALPLEITYANTDDRIRFYSSSIFHKGFIRTKTIVGRLLYYCHPPRLERYVKLVVEQLKRGDKPYREFWTRLGNRIIRVLIVPVNNKDGKQLGTVEIVEDLTDIINNPDEIKKKIVVL